MELRELIQRIAELPSLAWRSFGLISLLVGLSLLCANPTILAVPKAKTKPIAIRLAQQTSPTSAVSDDGDVVELEGNSDLDRRIKKRLITVALVGGVLLLLLAIGYGYLRMELTTRGFYSGRLQIAVGIASISVLAGAYFLWRWLVI